MTEPTWESRELPVLEAAVYLYDEMYVKGELPEAAEIADAAQLDIELVATALNALDGRYLKLERTGDLEHWFVSGVTGEARTAVGQWPTAESVLERLIAGIAEAADQEADPVKRGRLLAVARGLGSIANGVAVSVLSQVVGQHIPR